ncbi:MAG TPA: hypothetical protein VG755_00715 [Nannocystaceae bacterium]|nr:hypothetical protein [Nannocystaceae bacterium]
MAARVIDPYRVVDDDVPRPRRSSRLARIGIALGTTCVVASITVWIGCVAALVTDVPAGTVPLLFAIAIVLLALAAAFDHRMRHTLAARPDLSGRWPIECARRRRDLAFDLLMSLLAFFGLAIALGLAVLVVLP